MTTKGLLFVSIVVGIAMALGGYGYWALVGATVVLPACSTVCLWLATGWIPSLPHRDADIGATLRFGGLIIFNILVVYVAYNLDKVLIGWFWGAEALGIYGRAYQLATIPSESINAAIGGVAFTGIMATAYVGLLMIVLGQKQFYGKLLRGLKRPSQAMVKG
jgi:O-antigen/teichoic acid export membrane protein